MAALSHPHRPNNTMQIIDSIIAKIRHTITREKRPHNSVGRECVCVREREQSSERGSESEKANARVSEREMVCATASARAREQEERERGYASDTQINERHAHLNNHETRNTHISTNAGEMTMRARHPDDTPCAVSLKWPSTRNGLRSSHADISPTSAHFCFVFWFGSATGR
jgi:hypothetical protein